MSKNELMKQVDYAARCLEMSYPNVERFVEELSVEDAEVLGRILKKHFNEEEE